MPLADFWTWLENLEIASEIGATWWFPFLESIHVLTSTFLLGSILMLDLRLLGLTARSHAVSRITREIVPWTAGAGVLSTLTGLGMFITQATHYAGNRAFQVKMVLLVVAGLNILVFHFGVARSMDRWDTGPVTSVAARVAGAWSLVSWTGIMLAGRWIGHLSR